MQSILTLNSGSSSIKFSVFKVYDHTIEKHYSGIVDQITTNPFLKIKSYQPQVTTVLEKNLTHSDKKTQAHNSPYNYAINEILNWLNKQGIEVIAAGHRVTNGGTKYNASMQLNDDVLTYLDSIAHLMPLHQPYNLEGCKILKEKSSSLFQVVCFDTSFHTTCNKISQLFALPKKYTEEGIRRYGFHGLSYAYIVSQMDKYLPQDKVNGKIIIAHLGQGASMCAVNNKTSVATTLSFSSLDGLPMGTRCGNIDPGVILYFMTHYKMDETQIAKVLYKESGLLGVSGGISSDMRTLLNSDHPDAKLAIDLFVYKTAAWIGTLTAELQGLDGLIFTAGIGEHAAYVREKIVEKMSWLGAIIDKEKNQQNARTISAPNSKITVHVIPTDEELTIAKDTFELLSCRKSKSN